MKKHCLLYLFMVVLLSLSAPGEAAEIHAGQGIGYSPWSFPWVGTIVFNGWDAVSGAEFVVKTGDDVTPPSQANTDAKLIVPPLNYISWCNSYANPLVKNNENFNACYGNAQYSHWYVLDLNDLWKHGMRGVWVSIAAERVSPTDGLVPALTVFQGRQEVGSTLHWFPQEYQPRPVFWADGLKPFTGGTTQSRGWATAYDSKSKDLAQVTGWVRLHPGGGNYLTVVVGGDARRIEVKKTTVNDHPYALR